VVRLLRGLTIGAVVRGNNPHGQPELQRVRGRVVVATDPRDVHSGSGVVYFHRRAPPPSLAVVTVSGTSGSWASPVLRWGRATRPVGVPGLWEYGAGQRGPVHAYIGASAECWRGFTARALTLSGEQAG
jgi:hypothetical protein